MNRLTVLCAGILSAAGVVAAEMIVVVPGEGETTNVTARLAGDIGISANPGASGGGIVKVVGHYNTYTGPTTNNCGTLWPSFLGQGVDYGALGNTAELVLGQGTLKYTGQPATLSCPVVHTGGTGQYTVYDIGAGSSLTIGGGISSSTRLVKTGAGTLCFSCDGSTTINDGTYASSHYNGCYRMVLNANGDAPTTGGGGLTVAEGVVSFDKGAWSLGNGPLFVGAYTAASGEQEKEGFFDVRGADVVANLGDTFLGVHNGLASTTPNFRPSSAIRVYSGSLSVGAVFMGVCYWSGSGNDKVDCSNPRLEIHGGTVNDISNKGGKLMMSNRNGLIRSELLIDGGSLVFDYGDACGIECGNGAGSASCTNIIDISGTGRAYVGRILVYNNEVTLLTLRNGGCLECGKISNSAGTRVEIDIDGGILRKNKQNASDDLVPSTVTRFGVGARGGELGAYFDRGGLTPHVLKVSVPIATSPGVTGQDGGISISNDNVRSSVELAAACTYTGPTTIRNGKLVAAVAGALPLTTELRTTGGELVSLVAPVSVASASFGHGTTNSVFGLSIADGCPVVVSGTIDHAGLDYLYVNGYADSAMTALSDGDSVEIMRAPVSQLAALQGLAAKCSMANAPSGISGSFSAVESEGYARLVMSVAARTGALERDTLIVTATGTTTVDSSLDALDALLLDVNYAYGTPKVSSAQDLEIGLLCGSLGSGLIKTGDGTWTLRSMANAVGGDFTLEKGYIDLYGSLDIGDNTFKPSGAVAGGIYLHEGAALRCKTIMDGKTQTPMYFDGATLRLANIAAHPGTAIGNSTWKFHVGELGATIDLSEQGLDGGCTNLSEVGIVFDGSITKDPRLESDVPSGGVTFTGSGAWSDKGTLFLSGTKIPLRCRDGAVFVLRGLSTSLYMEPGSVLRTSRTTATWNPMRGFQLGVAGATKPVRLELPAASTNAPTFHMGWGGSAGDPTFEVNSPVEVAIVEDVSGWKGRATCPPGVYTGMVWATWLVKTDPDVTKFVLPERYRSTRRLTSSIVNSSSYQSGTKALVFTIEATGEDPDDPGQGGGDEPAGDAGGPLVLPAGSWDSPVALGTYNVIESLALGLCPGEFASAAVSGDVTIKSGTVWHHDFSNDLVDYDFLVVNGTLTVERGVTFDLGRTAETPPPRNFRVPVAQATGAIVAPRKLQATGTGGGFTSVDLTVDGGVLYVSPHKKGLWVVVQ